MGSLDAIPPAIVADIDLISHDQVAATYVDVTFDVGAAFCVDESSIDDIANMADISRSDYACDIATVDVDDIAVDTIRRRVWSEKRSDV